MEGETKDGIGLAASTGRMILVSTIFALVCLWASAASAYYDFVISVSTGPEKGQITVTPYTVPSNDPDYKGGVLVRSSGPIGWTPDNGQWYSVGDVVEPGVTVVEVYVTAMWTFTDRGLVPGATYYYKGWAHDSNYSYYDSGTGSAAANGVPPSFPYEPEELTAKPGNRRATLYVTPPGNLSYESILIARGKSHEYSWYPSDGVSYVPGDAAGSHEGIIVCNADVTHFTDVDLTNKQLYRYRVFSVSNALEYSGGIQIEVRPAKQPTSHYYEFVRSFGELGTGEGEFSESWGPRGIAWTQDGGIIVADPGNLRLMKFDEGGDWVSSTSPAEEPWCDDLCPIGPGMWSGGYTLFAAMGKDAASLENVAHTIDEVILEPSATEHLSLYNSYASICPAWRNSPIVPSYLTFYGCVKGNRTIYEMAEGINIWRSWTAPLGTASGEFDGGPVSIAQGLDGYLYIGDEGTSSGESRIQKFTIGGTFKEVVATIPEVPLDICVDQWGNFFVATSGCKVLKFDSDWSFLTGWGRPGTGPGEFSGTKRIAVDRWDRVYVADGRTDEDPAGDRNQRVQVFIESDRNGSDIVYAAYLAEPVNTETGNFSYEHTDFIVPGRGIGVEFSRVYNSQSDYIGDLGWGWRHSYEIAAAERADGSVSVEWENGREELFVLNESDEYVPAFPWIHNKLEKSDIDDTYTLTTKDQTEYHFSPTGVLQSITDRNGNSLTFAYNALGRLTTLTDASGRVFSFIVGGTGNIASIADPAGRVISFEYDQDGDLAAVTDARGNAESYEYDSEHRMLTVIDRRGNTIIQNAYDEFSRVGSQTYAREAGAQVTNFEYVTQTLSTPWGDVEAYTGTTNIIDALGGVTVHEYDGQGRLVRQTDPLGNIFQFAYDGSNNRTQQTNPNDNTTEYAFDSRANMIEKADPMSQTVSVLYDADNNVLQRTDEVGVTTTYTYDGNGNLVTSTDALGGVTALTYDGYGQMITKTDPLGHTTQYQYDTHGNLTSVTDPLGWVTTYTYDAVGRKLTETDALGGTTTWTYDENDNVASVTDALGRVTSFQYDENNNKTRETYADGSSRTFEYDQSGNLTRLVNERGHGTKYEYDLLDRRIIENVGGIKITAFAYDGANRLVSVTDANGNTTAYEYDSVGNRTILRGPPPDNAQTTYSYDSLNRLVTTTDALGNTTSYTYTQTRLVSRITDANGGSTDYAYDAIGRKTAETDRRGAATTFTYDAAGNLLSVTDPLGNTASHTYDAAGDRVTTTNALGQQTHYTYDALYRVIRITDPLGNFTETIYDAVGNVIGETDKNGNLTQFGYDERNRLISVVDALGNTTEYAYDLTGNLVSFIDARGKTTSYDYDTLNRLQFQFDPLSHSRSFVYDAVGSVLSFGDEDGFVTEYGYDAENRLITITYASDPPVSYTYDLLGRRTSMTDGIGTTNYAYDALGRLTQVTDPYGKSLQYSYDAEGNVTTLTYPGSLGVAYMYDATGRVATVTDWLGGLTSYTRDALGCIVRVGLSNGTYATYSFDAAGRLVGQADRNSTDELIAQYGIALDPAGNRVGIDRTQPLMPPTPNPVDEICTYDDANRILTRDGVTYTFSPRGSMTSRVEGSVTTNFTFDQSNRLISVSNPSSTATFAYNGDGHRLARTEDGVTTRFVIDPTGGDLWNVLCETDDAGIPLRYYVYGAGLIEMIEAGGVRRVYHYDPIGSTVAVTDVAEDVTDSYAYNEFGEKEGQTGASTNPYGFVGQLGVRHEQDSLLFMRVRYYDAKSGRFLSVDPVCGELWSPVRRHGYLYAANNPWAYVDSSGQWLQYAGGFVEGFFWGLGADIGVLIGEGIESVSGGSIQFDEERARETAENISILKDATMLALDPGTGVAGVAGGLAYKGGKAGVLMGAEAVGQAIAALLSAAQASAESSAAVVGQLIAAATPRPPKLRPFGWLLSEEAEMNGGEMVLKYVHEGRAERPPGEAGVEGRSTLVLQSSSVVRPRPHVPERYEPVARIVNKANAKDMR